MSTAPFPLHHREIMKQLFPLVSSQFALGTCKTLPEQIHR